MTIHLQHEAPPTAETRTATRTDPLTGLPNRLLLIEALQRHLSDYEREGRRFAVLIANVDHLGQINHEHGRAAGDAVLRRVARTLQNVVRASDTAGRWGEDEFLIVAPVGNRERAIAFADRLRSYCAARPAETPDGPMRATISIGVALVADDDAITDLVGRASGAVYAAKVSGRDRTALG